MNKLPDPNDYPTMTEWQAAMQEFYGTRREDRMRAQLPTIRVYDEWTKMESDWYVTKNKPILTPRAPAKPPSGDDLALVQMIKEDLKEAELLGWKIEMISVNKPLHEWLIEQSPAALSKAPETAVGWRLFGIPCGWTWNDEHHSPAFLSGTPPDGNGYMSCYTCWQKRGDE